MLKRFAAILLAATLTILTGAAPVAAYEGDTYDELIEDETLTDQHAIIIRFYAAVFGRTPDNNGVRFWLDQFDTGEWSTRRIANFFATSDEFKSLYGDNTTNAQFVDSVYPNVLGRPADATGREFWLGYLNDGNSRAEMILLVSNAPEFIQTNLLPFEIDMPAEPNEPAPEQPESEEPSSEQPTPDPPAGPTCDLLPVVTESESHWLVETNTISQPVRIELRSRNCPSDVSFSGFIAWQGGSTISDGGPLIDITLNWECSPNQQAGFEFDVTPSVSGDSVVETLPVSCELPPIERRNTSCGSIATRATYPDDTALLERTSTAETRADSLGCLFPFFPDNPAEPWCTSTGWTLYGESEIFRTYVNGQQVATLPNPNPDPEYGDAVWLLPAVPGDEVRFEWDLICIANRDAALDFTGTIQPNYIDTHSWTGTVQAPTSCVPLTETLLLTPIDGGMALALPEAGCLDSLGEGTYLQLRTLNGVEFIHRLPLNDDRLTFTATNPRLFDDEVLQNMDMNIIGGNGNFFNEVSFVSGIER